MTDTPSLTRRTVVRTGLGAAVALPLLAACGSDDSPTTTTATSAPAGTGGAGGSASGLPALDDIEVGSAVAATLNGAPIAIARTAEDAVVGFSAVCTHQQCTTNVSGATLVCPCHGSTFDALTGAVTKGPAQQPLASVPLTVSDGTIVAG